MVVFAGINEGCDVDCHDHGSSFEGVDIVVVNELK
jgi:hypothetical protein